MVHFGIFVFGQNEIIWVINPAMLTRRMDLAVDIIREGYLNISRSVRKFQGQ